MALRNQCPPPPRLCCSCEPWDSQVPLALAVTPLSLTPHSHTHTDQTGKGFRTRLHLKTKAIVSSGTPTQQHYQPARGPPTSGQPPARPPARPPTPSTATVRRHASTKHNQVRETGSQPEHVLRLDPPLTPLYPKPLPSCGRVPARAPAPNCRASDSSGRDMA